MAQEDYIAYCSSKECGCDRTFTYDPTGMLKENCTDADVYVCESCGTLDIHARHLKLKNF